MKVAIATDGGYVSSHFGRCPLFTIVEILKNNEVKKEIIKNPGHHPGYLPEFLSKMGINYIVAGGMGPRAIELFEKSNIETILGAEGTVDSIIERLKKGDLKGSESTCKPGSGKGYGLDKKECNHQ